MVTLWLKEKRRILTKVKVYNHTFCYAMGSPLWREGDRWKIRREKFLCSILCQLLHNKIFRNIDNLNDTRILLFFLLIIAWNGILCCRHMAEWLKWRHLSSFWQEKLFCGFMSTLRKSITSAENIALTSKRTEVYVKILCFGWIKHSHVLNFAI